MSLATTRLTCRAPHSDPAKRGEVCGAILGDVQGAHEWVGLQDRAPEVIDGLVRLPCRKRDCGKWNVYRVEAAPGVAVVEKTPDDVLVALLALPVKHQVAAKFLAIGVSKTLAAEVAGVHRNTLGTLCKDEQFCAAVDACVRFVGASIAPEHIALALRGWVIAIEKQAKKGQHEAAKDLLDRTIFSHLKAGGGDRGGIQNQAVNVNVGVGITGIIDAEWKNRQAMITTPAGGHE